MLIIYIMIGIFIPKQIFCKTHDILKTHLKSNDLIDININLYNVVELSDSCLIDTLVKCYTSSDIIIICDCEKDYRKTIRETIEQLRKTKNTIVIYQTYSKCANMVSSYENDIEYEILTLKTNVDVDINSILENETTGYSFLCDYVTSLCF